MKIMYVDISTDGHHLIYLNALLGVVSEESFAVLPEIRGVFGGRCHIVSKPMIRTFPGYCTWLKELRKIADEERPDVIHFLDGDSIMRYFGWGFSKFRRYKTVITFHHIFPGKLRVISMKNMLSKMGAGVFHTQEIADRVEAFGCKNVSCIPYPCFLNTSMNQEDGYQNNPPVLLALGGTRYDKGLDILLEALKSVKTAFRLIIAGREEDFHRKYIEEMIQAYESNVELKLQFLTEDELLKQLQCSDIVVLPYRKIFDGASGPMCEGVYLGKTIIGPSHGSLGKLIAQHHVGYTFESEDVVELTKCLEKALSSPFVYDQVAVRYQESLCPERFKDSYLQLYKKLICEKK